MKPIDCGSLPNSLSSGGRSEATVMKNPTIIAIRIPITTPMARFTKKKIFVNDQMPIVFSSYLIIAIPLSPGLPMAVQVLCAVHGTFSF